MKKESMKDQMKKAVDGLSVKKQQPVESLFGASKSPEVIPSVKPSFHASDRVHQDRLPKSDLYNQRVTLVINREQRDTIQKLAQKIQDNGVKKPERVTANTVVRCLINQIVDIDLEIGAVKDEDSLNKALANYFSKK